MVIAFKANGMILFVCLFLTFKLFYMNDRIYIVEVKELE